MKTYFIIGTTLAVNWILLFIGVGLWFHDASWLLLIGLIIAAYTPFAVAALT